MIYLDVLPRLGITEAETAFTKLKDMARKAGDEAGLSFSKGADSGMQALKDASVSAERVVSDNYRKMTVSSQQYEAQVKKVSEVEAARGRDSAAYLAATAKQTDLQMRATQATKDHSDAALAATAASTKYAAAHDNTGKSMLNLAGVANGVGKASLLAFGGALAVGLDKAADFQQGLVKLQASAGELPQNMKAVSDGIMQVMTQTGYGAGELNNAMYTIEKAGYRGADGIKVLSAAAQGASSEQADLGEVVDGLTTSMKDFNVQPEQATRLMSQMVTAVGESKSNFQDFAGALHSVEPAAAAAHLKLEDVWGTLAQMTQSGMSAAQSAVDMNQAITSLARPSDVQIIKMKQLGINGDEVSQKLGERGLAGTMQNLYEVIASHQDASTKLVDTGELTKNAGALGNLHDMLNATGDGALGDNAKKMAQGYLDGTVSAIDYRKAVMAANDEDKKKLQQFGQLTDQVNSFSKRLAGGRDTLETANAALGDLVGTQEAASVAFQTTGENAQATKDKIDAIASTYVNADGTVKGFDESQGTLNAKMRDAKSTFSAVAIELGEVFVPTMIHVANGLKDVSGFLEQHKDAVQSATYVVGGLGLAWAGVKTAMALGNTFKALDTGIDLVATKFLGIGTAAKAAAVEVDGAAATEVAAEDRVGGAAMGAASKIAAAAVAAWAFYETGKAIYDDATKDDAKYPGQTTPTDPTGFKGDQDRYTGGVTYGQGGEGMGFKVNPNFGPANSTVDRRGRIWGSAGETVPYNTADRRGLIPGSAGGVPVDASGNPIAALPAATAPMGFDPGAPGGAIDTGADKPPKGTKADSIWIKASDPSDFKNGDEDHGVTGSSIISGGFDFSPKSIGTFFTTLLADLALGNPIGKTLAAKRGESKDTPLYVTNVDVESAQARLDKAIRDNGPDSEEAKHAAAQLAGTQAAVGTTGGYYNPATGGITARDPSAVPGQAGKGAEGWRDTVAATVAKYGAQAGITPDKYGAWTDAIVKQIGIESGGDPNIVNDHDPNGRGGIQTVSGLLQYVPGSYAASGGKLTGLPMMSPEGQIAGALMAPRTANGLPAGLGQGGGWGPNFNTPISPAAPAATWGNDGASADPYVYGGGGESPVFMRQGGPTIGIGTGLTDSGPLLGGGQGGVKYPWRPAAYGGGSLIGTGQGRGPTATTPGAASASGGLFTPVPGSGGSGGVGAAVAPAARTWGSGKGASSSIGSSLASAAGSALDLIAPGSSEVAAKGGQLIDRTIGYLGQLGGIGVEGLMQSLIPTGGGGGIGDPSHSLIGRIAGGVAGAHKSAPNTAGTTAPPGPKPSDDPNAKGTGGQGGDTNHIGSQNNGTMIMGDAHISTPNAQSFASDHPENQYPTATR